MTGRWVWLAGGLLCSGAARAATPEVELGAGYAISDRDTSAPAVALRVGEDFGNLAASVRGLAIVGAEGLGYVSDGSRLDPTGFQAWQALAELRAHTDGARFQVHLALAGGIGKLLTSQPSVTEVFPLKGRLGLSWQASAGARLLVSDSVWLGAEIAVPTWTRIFAERGGRSTPVDDGSLQGIVLLFSVGFRPHPH